jgi:hypothetical protein
METDACLVGAAAVLRDPAGSDWCYLQWEVDAGSEFSDCCINYKEAAAVLLALLRWRRQLHNCRIAVYCDNAAACAIINKGSSREPRLLRLLQTVALLCLKQNIVVTAHHVPGRFQLFADAASRLHCRQELLNFLLRAYATCSVCPHEFAGHALSPASAAFLFLQVASLGLSTLPPPNCSSWPTHHRPRSRYHPLSAPGNASAESGGSTHSDVGRRTSQTTSASSWTAGSAPSAASACTSALSPPISGWRECRT